MIKFLSSVFGGPKEGRQVEFRTLGKTLVAEPGKTILETALNAGLAYPHNCTVGTCGACKTRLVQGKVKAVSDFGYTLSRQELEAGYILACQAIPQPGLTIIDVPALGADMPPLRHVRGCITNRFALTHDIAKVTVEVTEPIHYLAGQYASIKAPGYDRARNYSFASAPKREGLNKLTFVIRKVEKGAFTSALFDGALDGVDLEISTPYGDFYRRDGDGPMVCIAGGSGLSPLLGILDEMRMTRITRPCILLFGARTQSDLYELDAISNFQQAWGNKFKFIPVLSEEPAESNWDGARGFVTEHINKVMDEYAPAEIQAYMCGPPVMIDAAIERLVAVGVDLENIHYDKFTDGVSAQSNSSS